MCAGASDHDETEHQDQERSGRSAALQKESVTWTVNLQRFGVTSTPPSEPEIVGPPTRVSREVSCHCCREPGVSSARRASPSAWRRAASVDVPKRRHVQPLRKRSPRSVGAHQLARAARKPFGGFLQQSQWVDRGPPAFSAQQPLRMLAVSHSAFPSCKSCQSRVALRTTPAPSLPQQPALWATPLQMPAPLAAKQPLCLPFLSVSPRKLSSKLFATLSCDTQRMYFRAPRRLYEPCSGAVEYRRTAPHRTVLHRLRRRPVSRTRSRQLRAS